MPYSTISPDLSLFYITNSPNNDLALFDLSKPTILLLHPLALDSSWLRPQFQDPRLSTNFNMIAFDQRNAGRTRSKYSSRRDSYVDAADLAFAHELLQLPPVHVFGAQLNSVWAAYRFALLFPDKCLSLCLCGVPSDVPLPWTHKAFTELIEAWCFPPDLDTYEQAIMEMSYFLFDGQMNIDLQDEIAAWWSINMPPARRRAVIELTLGRGPPTPDEYARISHPTLMITGEKSMAHPPEEALKIHEKIADSQIFIVKGAPEMFQILPQYAGITNRVYAGFLARQPPPPTPSTSTSQPDLERVGRAALARLADLRGDPAIATRDPTSPLSFSMWPPEVVAANQAYLDQMEEGEAQAFSPVDKHGRPFRKFSRRHDDQWTKAAFDKMQNNVEAVKGIQVLNHA